MLCTVGSGVGIKEGSRVGVIVGFCVAIGEGSFVGCEVGSIVGFESVICLPDS